jgi:iron(III) transport system ATP-binding protein/putative spermidine/putrescine transport system ATP-binding protein
MVFQSYAIWPHLSVFENVAFSLKLRRMPSDRIERRVKDALELVGLGGLASRGAHQLSGGQLQRVALARAVVAEPRVLLFDEPLSNLDAALRERMRFELRQLQQQLGITSIYVTHDQHEAMAIADRIVLLDKGLIVQIDEPMSLYNSPSSLFAAQFIGNANVFPGEVTASEPAATIRVTDDLCLASMQSGFAPREAVHVGFRPEQIRVSLTPLEGPNCFPARVRHNVFLGSLSDLALGIGDLQIRGQSCPPVPWTADTDIWVQIPTEAVIVLRH